MATEATTTLRDRAIVLREDHLAHQLRRQDRGFRDEYMPAEEHEAYSQRLIAKLRRELATLRAMPADVSDDDVRRAMGVQS